MEEQDKQVTNADIFSTQHKVVVVKNTTFFVHELDWAADAIDFQKEGNDGMLSLLIASVRDAEGNPIWSKADLPVLRRFSRVRLFALVSAALEVNGFNAEDNDAKPPAQTSMLSIN